MPFPPTPPGLRATALVWARAHETLPPSQDMPPAGDETPAGRTRLGALDPHLHCSVIGTCLPTAELRKAMAEFVAVEGASDLDVHHEAVRLAAHDPPVARALHRLLDRRHAATLQRWDGADGTEAALGALWTQALRAGDVPGAYWALLTHRRTTPALRQRGEAAEALSGSHAAEATRLRGEIDHLQGQLMQLAQELAMAEAQLAGALATPGDDDNDSLAERLRERRVLYVGGRPSTTHALRALVARHGGDLRKHDGGLEDRKGLLAPAIAWADLVVFPVDCIDHDSAQALKRSCVRQGKPFVALRSASLASFAAAVARHQAPAPAAGPSQCLRHA